jgi:hypothetical protein
MENQKSEEVLEIKDALLMDFYPENLQNSKLFPYLTEQLSFKISDFSLIYHKTDIESVNILKQCDFLNISENIVEYNEEEINNIFIIDETFLNEYLIKQIRNIKNVVFNRFYKKPNFKWVFVPTKQSKENFMSFMKNKNIKMFNLKKSSIVNNINYLKESNGLKDRRKNSDFSNNGNNKWRKFSKNYASHKGSYNSNYYNNNNNNYYKGHKGRERFNSDTNNYTKNNNNEYFYGNNINSPNKKTEKIEVEIGEIKYPLTINYKYSINNIKDLYQKLKQDNYFQNKPDYLVENNEIISNEPKELEILKNISTSSNIKKETQAFNRNELEGNNCNKIKIPKFNPLSQMKKNFNKFDAIPSSDEILVK